MLGPAARACNKKPRCGIFPGCCASAGPESANKIRATRKRLGRIGAPARYQWFGNACRLSQCTWSVKPDGKGRGDGKINPLKRLRRTVHGVKIAHQKRGRLETAQ